MAICWSTNVVVHHRGADHVIQCDPLRTQQVHDRLHSLLQGPLIGMLDVAIVVDL